MRTLRDLLIGLFIAYWVGELAVIAVWGEQPKFPRRVVEAPWGLRYNDPGASYRHKSADVEIRFRINEQGMRADESYSYEKPEDTIRIVSLGDSYAMGYEVEDEQIYSSILGQSLRDAGYRVQVLNAGVSGFSTAEELVYLERELIKYEPDVVLVGFFYNDFSDNVRTNLFEIDEEGRLQQKSPEYVPLGRVGNILNSNPVFNFLSAYSNSFVLLKERATVEIKRAMAARGRGEAKKAAERELEVPDLASGPQYRVSDYERELLVGILERLYSFCRERDVALIVQSIPTGGMLGYGRQPDRPFADLFPYEEFDGDRPGLAIVPTIDLLMPHFQKRELINPRSHNHWTPFAHQLSADRLAQVMLSEGLITAPASAGLATRN